MLSFIKKALNPVYGLTPKQPRLGTDLSQIVWKVGEEKEDQFTGEDLMRGVCIFGSIGSGKTSGSGRAIATSFLRSGFGGLVLCVKEDEAATWQRYAEEAGRQDDLVFFSPDENCGFNFLEYEKQTSDGSSYSLAHYLLEIMEVLSGTAKKSSDSFWEDSQKELIQNLMTIELARSKTLSVMGLYELFKGIGRKKKEKPDEVEPPCKSLGLDLLEKNADFELKLALEYLRKEFPRLAPNTRSVIENAFSSQLNNLLRSPIFELFQKDTTVTPDDALHGKIVIVDVSTKKFKSLGRVSNLIWKTSFKRAVERRGSDGKPVFVWIDEYQELASPQDPAFQATARSQRCATVVLSQNYPGYEVVLKDKARVESLLANLNIKIFHQNGDPGTNEYGSKCIQSREKLKKTQNKSADGKVTYSTTKVREREVQPEVFVNLKSGGYRHNKHIEAIVAVPGHKFANNRAWKKVSFMQDDLF